MKKLFVNYKIHSENLLSKKDKKDLIKKGAVLELKNNYKLCKLSNGCSLIKDSKFLYFIYYNKIFPTIQNFNDNFKKIILDEGAIKPLKNGANVFAAGVRKFKQVNFLKDEPVGIEILGKIIAVGLTLSNYENMSETVIDILHVEGDALSETLNLNC